MAYKKIFEEDTNIDYVWKIVESARRQKHGTMLLFTENALSESERLREAGYQVSVKEMVSARSIEALGEIDGAMLLGSVWKVLYDRSNIGRNDAT